MTKKKSGKPRGLVERLAANGVSKALTTDQFIRRHGRKYKTAKGQSYSDAYLKRVYHAYQRGATTTKQARGHGNTGKTFRTIRHRQTKERQIIVPWQWITAVTTDPENKRGTWPTIEEVNTFGHRHAFDALQLQVGIHIKEPGTNQREVLRGNFGISTTATNYPWRAFLQMAALLLQSNTSQSAYVSEAIKDGKEIIGLFIYYDRAPAIQAKDSRKRTDNRRKK